MLASSIRFIFPIVLWLSHVVSLYLCTMWYHVLHASYATWLTWLITANPHGACHLRVKLCLGPAIGGSGGPSTRWLFTMDETPWLWGWCVAQFLQETQETRQFSEPVMAGSPRILDQSWSVNGVKFGLAFRGLPAYSYLSFELFAPSLFSSSLAKFRLLDFDEFLIPREPWIKANPSWKHRGQRDNPDHRGTTKYHVCWINHTMILIRIESTICQYFNGIVSWTCTDTFESANLGLARFSYAWKNLADYAHVEGLWLSGHLI